MYCPLCGCPMIRDGATAAHRNDNEPRVMWGCPQRHGKIALHDTRSSLTMILTQYGGEVARRIEADLPV